jgi:hypothetical protein
MKMNTKSKHGHWARAWTQAGARKSIGTGTDTGKDMATDHRFSIINKKKYLSCYILEKGKDIFDYFSK